MRFAIFSDIHANLEALEAVLADARQRKCTHFVCLGDVVGYNANPHECLEQVRDFTIVHATLDTPEQWGYVFNNLDAAASFTYQHTTICFFGHTHVPMVFIRDEGVRRELIDHVRIEPTKKYFINVGSVGQPRDGNWRAAYCVYDVENNLVQQIRVKYDLATAQKKVIEAGLPRPLAERLAMGR